ncbi:MAG: hypothetical protein R8K47_08235 [Mariprofundaceae bacterium]
MSNEQAHDEQEERKAPDATADAEGGAEGRDAATASPAGSDTPEPQPEKARKPTRRGGIVLLAVLMGAAALVWLALRDDVPRPAFVESWLEPQKSASDAGAPTARPTPPPVKPAQTQPLVQTPPAAQTPRAPRPRHPALSRPEAEALMRAIDGLHARLDEERAEREALAEALQRERTANLITRLRWIADPASRTPQLRIAWEAVALMPGLSAEERATAREMAALARRDEAALGVWRAALARWIDALHTPVADDVLPRPDHPWLAWIVGQFHLRPADSPTTRATRELRRGLEGIDRRLALEDWPEAEGWRSLRARLLLHLEAQRKAGIDLGLPEDFSSIRADQARMRQTARDWLNRLLSDGEDPADASGKEL